MAGDQADYTKLSVEELEKRRKARRPLWLATAAFAVLFALAGFVGLTKADNVGDCTDLQVVELEIAGSPERVESLLERCNPIHGHTRQSQLDGIRSGLWWDFLFIVLYAAVLALPCVIAHQLAPPRGRASRGFLRLGACAAVMAGLLDAFENIALFQVLDDLDGGTWPVLAFAAAVPKFVLLLLSAFAALGGARHIAQRLIRPKVEERLTHWQSTGDRASDRAFDIPDRPARANDEDTIGIACSGGGIRSASFCMGAMQSFYRHKWPGASRSIVNEADCITSVSGGGYYAGARQLLAYQGVEQPFAARSHEEDYVRRHGRYLADGFGEWLAALARVLAGVLLNIGLFVLLLYLAARPAGWLQRELICDDQVAACADGEYKIGAANWAALALPAGVAMAFVLAFVLVRERSDTSNPFRKGDLVLRGAAAAAIGALGAASMTLLVPGVTWALRSVLQISDSDSLATAGRPTVTGSTIFALAWAAIRFGAGRLRPLLKGRVKSTGADDEKAQEPNRVMRLASLLTGAALAVAALVLFAGFVEDALDGPSEDSLFGWADWVVWALLVGVVALLWFVADQTTWSLHSLYRRRLATAFVLEPVLGTPAGPDAPAPIVGYEERRYQLSTKLSEMGGRKDGQPKLVLCAAANLSGCDVAPPGRRAVGFTFEHDWVGSPQLGYIGTENYERSLAPSIQSDATLLAGMAISGAAVASAMGRHSKGSLQTLFVLANVRLGVWLSTPKFADQYLLKQELRPRSRGVGYLFRELFGLYDSAEAFTYLSDGGHYENLALVELLRRRCTYVFCLDASGGPATLAEAIQLAETELGVTIDIPESVLRNVRTAPAADGDDSALAGRVAPAATIVAKITYPPVTGLHMAADGSTSLPEKEGWLIYGRAVITGDTPATVRDYAGGNARFPNDPTGDQWFDADQFDNYLLLGRHVGEEMAKAISGGLPPTPTPPEPPSPQAAAAEPATATTKRTAAKRTAVKRTAVKRR